MLVANPNNIKKNYIAYSLWGTDPLYNVGMISNIKQAKIIYPGWQVIVYHDDSVPRQVIDEIISLGAITVHINNGTYGMFWRFYAIDLPDCGYVIFRDSDSRLSLREKAAVDEWLNSGNTLHIMRDHPYHQHLIDGNGYHILGGMWGIKGHAVNMTAMINEYALGKALTYGSDQFFLDEIYHQFKNSVTLHDELFSNSPFPVKRKGYRFIGERFTEHNEPDPDTWKVLRTFYRDKSKYWQLVNFLKARLKHLLK